VPLNWDEDMSKYEEAVTSSLTNRLSTSSQTILSNRKIEKIMIRNMKLKKEVEEYKHMLEDSYEKLSKFKKLFLIVY